MDALARCAGARLAHYRAGQTLIRVGERDFKFFVVKSGEIEILDECGETPATLAVLGRMSGDSHLRSVELVNKTTGETRTLKTPARSPRWTGGRQPFLLETSRTGVLPPVMCGRARSSAPAARARLRSRSCTNT